MHLGPLVTALVDEELQDDVRRRALEHAARCPSCTAEIDAQRRLKARVGVAPLPAPPEALTRRLLELAAPAPPQRTAARRAGRAHLLTGTALSLGGVVVVGTALAFGASAPRQQPPVQPPADLLTVQQRTTARSPLPPPEQPLLRPPPPRGSSTPAPLVRPMIAPVVLTSVAPRAPASGTRR